MESSVPAMLQTSEPSTRSHSRTPSAMRRRQETTDSAKAGRVWARDVDDPWAPCILTLDGGGIRGYSSMLILKELMHEIWLCEERLDVEEQSEQEDAQLARSDIEERGRRKPLENADAVRQDSRVAGAGWSAVETGRLHEQLQHDAQRVERQYGVELPTGQHHHLSGSGSGSGLLPQFGDLRASDLSEEPLTERREAPAARTIGKDKLTSNVTARKALSEEELLPCHYFDFMYGTSTGGLIATILGRLRMTVSEGLDLYRGVGDNLFGRRRSNIPLMTKYHHEPLEKAVQDIVASRCYEHVDCDGKDDLHPWEVETDLPFRVDEPRVCQSCCLTATHDEQISEAYLLRSYPHYYAADAPNWITRYNEGADELPIWKVTRATSAAPFYFEMVTHMLPDQDGKLVEKSFKDGGIRENNPSGAALSEFHSLYEGKADTPALLLSVGTGRPNQKADGFADTWPGPFGKLNFVSKMLEKRAVVSNVLIKYTEGEKQHHLMRTYARGENTWYKRLNVADGLQTFPLDEWVRGEWHGAADVPGGKSLTEMERVTARELAREFDENVDSYAPPKVMIKQAAEKLVRQRRARERLGGRRWDVFVGAELKGKKPAQSNGG
nr:isoform sh-ipla2 of 85/88 kda calcium-independent phospholipase a2 [Quercus suber]